MIGPVYPFKGGISHYTSLMCRSLRDKHEVAMVSFSMQYPKFLYRGKQKDLGNTNFEIDGTRFILHTANPINWLTTAARIRKEKPDLVIFQWWHPYFAPCYYTLANQMKCSILFVCHNVLPHESFPLDAFLTKRVLRKGSFFIVHANSEAEELKKIVKDPVYKICSMPTFSGFSDCDVTREELREKLSIPINAKVLLFFGLIRDYKGLDVLLRTMPRLIRDMPELRLLIAGKFGKDKDKYDAMIAGENLSDYVGVYNQYIPDDQVSSFFCVSDLVVLPYKSATQSAVVQMAFGFGKPVVVTDVGGLPEVVMNNRTGFVIPSENEDSLYQVVMDFFRNKKAAMFERNIRSDNAENTWSRITDAIDSMCERK